ncbi:MAG: hypothetical protein ACLUZZ_05365 [Alistipes inops]
MVRPGAAPDSSVRSYSVTHYRPDREDAAVRWRDSEGHEGEIAGRPIRSPIIRNG